MKIVSTRAELAVLRGLTHRDKKVAGTLHSRIDSSYFYSPESVEIYESVLKHFAETGESPPYRLVVTDPELSDEARQFFRESSVSVNTIADANKAARILNKYRQTRGLYNLAAHIGDQVKRSRVDIAQLIEDVGKSVAQIHARKASSDAFEHFGLNNNSNQAFKDMLYGDMSEDVIPTGIPEFDSQSGGFVRGSLVTIGASSGGGKCGDLGTEIQLSTLVITLSDTWGTLLEVEPEDLLLVTDLNGVRSLRSASLLRTGDDIETDPEILAEHLLQYR